MKIKVLIVLEATLGGTRKHVVDILERIDLSKFDVCFCYSTARADRLFFVELLNVKKRGIECIEISMHRNISPIKDFISFINLFLLIKKRKFDIVHCHSSKAGFLGRFASKIADKSIKTVYTSHSMPYNLKSYYSILEKLASLATDKIIAVAESEKKEIISKGIIKESRIVAINAGIDINSRSIVGKGYIRNILNIPVDYKIIISVGRLSYQKDPLTFFYAANVVQKQHPKCYFIWIGDGELRKEVDSYISSNNPGKNRIILGWRTDVNDLLSGADVFVLTSIYESFGYVTCEALLNGVPAIGTNVTGTKDIIENNVSGFLVDPKDYNKIGELIIQLLSNDSIRDKFIENGYQRLRKYFDVRDMVKNTELLYKSLLTYRGAQQ